MLLMHYLDVRKESAGEMTFVYVSALIIRGSPTTPLYAPSLNDLNCVGLILRK